MVDHGGCISGVLGVRLLVPGLGHLLLVYMVQHWLFQYTGLLAGGFCGLPCDTVLVRQFPVLCLEKEAYARAFYHGIRAWSDYFKMIEVCSGLGGVSHGASAAGIHTTVATALNDRMSDCLKVHVDCEHVTGELGDLQACAKVWTWSANTAMMCARFLSLPFSQLGDCHDGRDPRALTLPKRP